MSYSIHSALPKIALLIGLITVFAKDLSAQDHGHLNVGARGTNQNDELYFANGGDFVAADYGYIKTLDFTNGGRFAGFYQGNITLTVLPATATNAGPDPNAPAFGAYIQFKISCLAAPTDGSFQFWDAGTTNPSISLTQGQVSSNLWRLTEADGSPGADPYGHIHGRRFTATKAGFYKLGFTAVDTSTNGAGGGPIHRPTSELAVNFQAGINIHSVIPFGEHRHIRFPSPAGRSWFVEASTSLGTNANWRTLGNALQGTDYFHEVIDITHDPQQFYRLRSDPPPPAQ